MHIGLNRPPLALTADAARELANIMIVINTRPLRGQLPEHLDLILNLEQTRHIKLEQLNHADIEKLICQRLNVHRLPASVTELILTKAEGHPFFSEELAYSLFENHVIVVENGECTVAPGSDLQARISPIPCRELSEAASIACCQHTNSL